MGRRGRLVLMAEVDVDRLPRRGHGGGERLVRRLATAQVAKRPRVVEVADAHGARVRKPWLDAVPRPMVEVERESQRRIERAEEELERSLVSRLLERDPNRPEPVAEVPHA